MALLVSMMVVMVVVVPGRMMRTGRGCRRQQGASHGQPQSLALNLPPLGVLVMKPA